MPIRLKQRFALTTALLTALPATAIASSFQIQEQSVSRLGTAFAGSASNASDASTVFNNPAGMSQLQSTTWTLTGTVIRPEAEFRDGGGTTAGGPAGKTDDASLVPAFYFVQPLNDIVTLGIGINAPFGLASSYDEDSNVRYHATDSELQVMNINPALSFKVNDRLSLGFGVDFQRIDATLENQLPLPIPGPSGYTPKTDSSAKIEGDDEGVAYDLSLFYTPTESTTIGVVYRTGADFTLDGQSTTNLSTACAGAPTCAGAYNAVEGDIAADISLPDTLTLSVSQALGAGWALHGDIAWTEWSAIQNVEVRNTDNGVTVSTLDLQYDDTIRYALGATYDDGNGSTWRFGVAFDEAPQTDKDHVSARIPDQDRTWLAFGYGHRFSDTASISVGYAHLFVDDIRIDDTTSPGARLNGEFEDSVDILGVQGTWRF